MGDVTQTGERAPYTESFIERLRGLALKPKLDVQVCDHCNLRCAGCLHFAPLAPEHFLDLGEYERDLGLLADVKGFGGYFDSIVLMGGEPLLHPQIAAVISATRAIAPDESITLCTNGLLLKRMADAFWDAVVANDVLLSISAYPIRVDYAALVDLARGHGAQVALAGDVTRTGQGKEALMRLALDPSGSCDPRDSFVACPFGGRFLQMNRGALWPCQVAAHGRHFADRFGCNMRESAGDALLLADIRSMGDIEDFRRRTHPLCRFCDNRKLSVVPWERSQGAAEEWLSSVTLVDCTERLSTRAKKAGEEW